MRKSSFVTSSKGSKTTPVSGLMFASFNEQKIDPFSLFAGENLRAEDEEAVQFNDEDEYKDEAEDAKRLGLSP
ncbi:hypothetical protein F0562_017881 [Nyssa sinensis]|uniref:Uncharacterized protein n=1 Tax=Nyssa sinensis TaxID=561372 RepID=A0A5J4ZAI6_9ASTE|nr:hypothetical protein F0562_017881 [Nyssa sinensis]